MDPLPALFRHRGRIMDWLRAIRYAALPCRTQFLGGANGVIHVGANLGQERFEYAAAGLRVLWIEPIPEIFERLCVNVMPYQTQRPINALVSDCDDEWHELHVTNNDGASSSMMELAKHQRLWPRIHEVRRLRVRGVTLPTLLARIGEDMAHYDALVIDTQGSELVVLRGLREHVRQFRRIQVEAADFEAYVGCCTADEISGHLKAHGFREASRRRFAGREGIGNYFNLMFVNAAL